MKNRISLLFRLLAVSGASLIITQSVYAAEQASSDLYERCKAEIVSNPTDYCGGKDAGAYERCVILNTEECVRNPFKYFPPQKADADIRLSLQHNT